MDYVVVAFSDEDLAKGKVTVYWEIKLLNLPPPPLPSIKCPINTNKCFPIPLPPTLCQFGQDFSAWVLIRGKICSLADRVFLTILSHWSLTLVILHQSVTDPGEVPPLFLDQTEARRAEKFFWRLLPPQRPLPLPPFISRSGSGTANDMNTAIHRSGKTSLLLS